MKAVSNPFLNDASWVIILWTKIHDWSWSMWFFLEYEVLFVTSFLWNNLNWIKRVPWVWTRNCSLSCFQVLCDPIRWSCELLDEFYVDRNDSLLENLVMEKDSFGCGEFHNEEFLRRRPLGYVVPDRENWDCYCWRRPWVPTVPGGDTMHCPRWVILQIIKAINLVLSPKSTP